MGYANTTPYEIIAAPYTVWTAPVGTAFPTVIVDPSASWTKVGTNGNLNYGDSEGVTVALPQTTTKFRALGDSGARKIFRTEEDLMIRLMLHDITLEQFAHALNGNSITTVASSVGVAGTKKIGLSRGFTVATYALLVRGPSPYGDDMTLQFEVPIAAQSGSPEVVFVKGTPVGLALEWTALVDPSASSDAERFGRLRAQHEDADT
jgi:hypothetical protein